MHDNELISAFLDDALDAQARAAFEARLSNEPELVDALARQMESDDALRAAFYEPMQETPPQRFLDLLGGGDSGATVVKMADLSAAAPRAANDNPKRWWWTGGAVAACAAALLVVTTQHRNVGQGVGDMVAFNAALDSTPSATSAALKDGNTLTPQLSFASKAGGYCRQFALSGAKDSQDGIACRDKDSWKIEALMKGSRPATPDGGYGTAAGASDAKLDAVMEALRGGDPLDPAAEQALIRDGWRAKP